MKRKNTYYPVAFAHLIALFLTIAPFISYGQVTDNFTDGDFSYAPKWQGNDTDFIVNSNKQLQLNSSGTSISYLRTANTQPLNNCQWSFWIHLNFSPSAGNYARVYLVSDKSNLSSGLNGYYLQFGESLSGDQVELFRQTGTSSRSICRGSTIIADAFSIRVKVTRDNLGLWKLYIDPTGGTNYTLEASGTDHVFNHSSFGGIFCNYTGANASEFFFDDFYINSPPDNTPATIDSVKMISDNKIDVYFSEELSTVSAQTLANYSVNNGFGFAASSIQDSANLSLVHLTFVNNFVNGQSYILTATGVQDWAGNNTVNATNAFLFFVPQANDIVINEIMADLSPAPNSLPPYEYIELHNRTHYPAELRGWELSDATSSVIIPNTTILPDSFLVLTSASAAASFGNLIPVVGIAGFPSLNDAGDDLILRDARGNIISLAFYRDTWYNDAIKNGGGWSMEQIDPGSSCSGKPNWKASNDNSGGTPGRKNSVYSNVPDITPPLVSYVTILSPNSIQLFFNEYMDSTTLLPLAPYSIDNGIGNPVSANPAEPDYSSVILTLGSPIAPGIIYTITVQGTKDCAGNTVASGSTIQFAIPEPVAANDIVINEVMFDPKDPGIEWVEIYNRSNKIIDLKEIYLCSIDNNGSLTDINQIAPNGHLIFPQDYIVMSTDAASIKTQYNTINSNGFIDMSSFPSLNNDSDHVVLINVSQNVIDQLQYHSSWHLPLLNDTKGISLERVNYESATQDPNNWHSAAESAGGATPAYQNSQYTSGETNTEITISPEVFSPDNDGYNDILSISYAFDTPGMIGNVQIYDSRGRLEKTLVRNELLSTSGTFYWDGITDEKTKARLGIYIIHFEAFDTKGSVKKYKKSCVVGGKL